MIELLIVAFIVLPSAGYLLGALFAGAATQDQLNDAWQAGHKAGWEDYHLHADGE